MKNGLESAFGMILMSDERRMNDGHELHKFKHIQNRWQSKVILFAKNIANKNWLYRNKEKKSFEVKKKARRNQFGKCIIIKNNGYWVRKKTVVHLCYSRLCFTEKYSQSRVINFYSEDSLIARWRDKTDERN